MLKKTYKTINKGDTGEINIYGNNHWIDINYDKVPEWANNQDDSFPSFEYKGNTYFLNEIMRLEGNHLFGDEFHGYSSDSAFSGILIKLSDCGEMVQVFTYIS